MKLFRLLLTFILSFILVSCDSIEKAINGDGPNFDFDGQSEVQEDGIYYADNNSEQPSKSNSSKKSFTVSFYDGDESLLDSDTFQYGEQPKYFGPKPTKKSFDNNMLIQYSFIGWSENKYDSIGITIEKLPIITKDTNYYSVFTVETIVPAYKVTFMNEECELDSSYFIVDKKPTFNGAFPTKDDDGPSDDSLGYSYSFVGWSEDPHTEPSQAIKEEDLPGVIKDTVYFAIFKKSEILFTLSETSVELDCNDPSQSGVTQLNQYQNANDYVYSPYFPNSVTVDAIINQDPSNYRVEWSLSSGDSDFFSISPNTNNLFSVDVICLKSSRLATLTAKLINKNDEVIGIKICQLRSVMTMVYYASNGGSNGVNVGMCTNFSFSDNSDYVFPSKIKLSKNSGDPFVSNYPVTPVTGLFNIGELLKNDSGKTYCNRYPGQKSMRNLFIPNSVSTIYSSNKPEQEFFLSDLSSSICVYFEERGNNILKFDSYHNSLSKMFENNLVKSFPFNEYRNNNMPFNTYSRVSSMDDFKQVFNGFRDVSVRKGD